MTFLFMVTNVKQNLILVNLFLNLLDFLDWLFHVFLTTEMLFILFNATAYFMLKHLISNKRLKFGHNNLLLWTIHLRKYVILILSNVT